MNRPSLGQYKAATTEKVSDVQTILYGICLGL
jgi:hypothetical protein